MVATSHYRVGLSRPAPDYSFLPTQTVGTTVKAQWLGSCHHVGDVDWMESQFWLQPSHVPTWPFTGGQLGNEPAYENPASSCFSILTNKTDLRFYLYTCFKLFAKFFPLCKNTFFFIWVDNFLSSQYLPHPITCKRKPEIIHSTFILLVSKLLPY